LRHAFGQHSENVRHTNTQPADARSSAALDYSVQLDKRCSFPARVRDNLSKFAGASVEVLT
jgi:hypothetical protein